METNRRSFVKKRSPIAGFSAIFMFPMNLLATMRKKAGSMIALM